MESPDGELQRRVRQETARRLDAITAEPGAVLKWDRNGDGRLDDIEWATLRAVVESEVVRDLSEAPDTEPGELVGEDTEEWDVEASFVDPHMDLPILEVIDKRYEVLKELGRGAQGQTHLGRHRESGDYVAIKELAFQNLDSWKSLELFDREAEVLRALDHPSIPSFVDSFHVDLADKPPRFFLVQEFVPGTGLDVLLARGERFAREELLEFSEQMLQVLGYLHSLNPPVVHRDVKPSNIIRRSNGRYALVDFGGVQLIVQDDVGGSTVVGTSGYMPPEQLTGRAVPQSDLYGLGTTLIHLCTHVHPSKLPTKRLKLSWRGRANLDDRLSGWIDRLVEPVVEDRFERAEAAREHLPRDQAPAPVPVANTQMSPQRRQMAQYSAPHVPSEERFDIIRQARRDLNDARIHIIDNRLDIDLGKETSRTVAGIVIVIAVGGALVTFTFVDMFAAILLLLFVCGYYLAVMFERRREHLTISPNGFFKLEQSKGFETTNHSGVLADVEEAGGHLLLRTEDHAQLKLGEHVHDSTRMWVRERITEYTNQHQPPP